MNHPVCVVIPTYNRALLIPETLDSILTQTTPPAEVIVVDDGSTDDTRQVVSRFPHPVTLITVENGGDCRARNAGASRTNQPWIAFCDSDDLWRKDKLEQGMALHRDHPQVGFSFTNFQQLAHGTVAERTKFDQAPADQQKIYGQKVGFSLWERSLYAEILAFQPVWPSSLLMRRDFFTQAGGWGENHGRNPSADLEFILRCVRQPPVGILHEPLLMVRKHDTNFSGDAGNRVEGEIRILEFIAKHHGVDAATHTIIQHQIHLRRADLCYGMFHDRHFKDFLSLSDKLPQGYLDNKMQVKRIVSRLPQPLANLAHSLLVGKS